RWPQNLRPRRQRGLRTEKAPAGAAGGRVSPSGLVDLRRVPLLEALALRHHDVLRVDRARHTGLEHGEPLEETATEQRQSGQCGGDAVSAAREQGSGRPRDGETMRPGPEPAGTATG